MTILQYFTKVRERRDNVYDYILLTDAEERLLQTKVLARLDRIRQTPTACYIYPTAVHTRLDHSLGVMHLAGEITERILLKERKMENFLKELIFSSRKKEVDKIKKLMENAFDILKLVQIKRIEGLLHDCGHTPFSHTLEFLLGNITHEDMSVKLVREDPEIKEIFLEEKPKPLDDLDIKLDDIITQMEKKEDKYDYLRDIVHGTFGADPLDYIARDAVNSGTLEYGKIDVRRIIDNLVIVEREGEKILVPSTAAREAIFSYFESWYKMYFAVYYHKHARSMDVLISRMVDQICKIYRGEERVPDLKIFKILSNLPNVKVIDYLYLHDYSLVSEIEKLISELESEKWKKLREKYPKEIEILEKLYDLFSHREFLECVQEELLPEEISRREKPRHRILADIEKYSSETGIPEDFIFIDVPQDVRIPLHPLYRETLDRLEFLDEETGKLKELSKNEVLKRRISAFHTRSVKRVYTLKEHSKKLKTYFEKLSA